MKEEAAVKPKFPTRDAEGRVQSMIEFLASSLLATVFTFALLAGIDLLFAGFSTDEFGGINGWMCVVLAAFLFVDDFKAWSGTRFRVPVFIAAVLLATVTGLGVNVALPDTWLPLVAGGLAGTASVIIYVVLWFTGIRLIGREE
ncbi:MAG TPA: hypothetical protein VGF17_00945 [Phytomonospora sp.]